MKNIISKMVDYSWLGSWAICENDKGEEGFSKSTDIRENIDFNKYEKELQQNNFVILAMNPGGESNLNNLNNLSRKKKVTNPWNNFHNKGRSNDHFLASAFNKSKLRGSYMTDFLPIIGSESNKISEIINDLEKNNKEVLERLVRELDTEISTLLPDYEEVNLICLGEKAAGWAKKFLSDEQSRFSNLEKKYKVYQIYHYSFFASTARKKYAEKHNIENNYSIIVKHQLNEQGLKV